MGAGLQRSSQGQIPGDPPTQRHGPDGGRHRTRSLSESLLATCPSEFTFPALQAAYNKDSRACIQLETVHFLIPTNNPPGLSPVPSVSELFLRIYPLCPHNLLSQVLFHLGSAIPPEDPLLELCLFTP